MKISKCCKWLILIGAGIVLFASGQAAAFNSDANENLILFGPDGQVSASYHLDDFTAGIAVSGSDYKVASEEYPDGPLSKPVIHYTPVPISDSASAVPNVIGESLPAPPGGTPEVSLFSFDDAVFESTTSTKPGVSFSPSSGTYSQTFSVSVKANPSTAVVEYREAGGTWQNTDANRKILYIYKTAALEFRAKKGSLYSQIKTASYKIDRPSKPNPEMVDTDKDGLPDSWEILQGAENGFDPLETDRDKDTDGDGISDFNEMLRGYDSSDPCNPKICMADIQGNLSGSDTPTEDDLALMATVGGMKKAYDSDGDGWSDFDETYLRGTDPSDAGDHPSAGRLNEVERILSGTFYDIDDVPVPDLHYRVTSFGSKVLMQGVTKSTGNYGQIRVPVGNPAVIRGAGLPDPANPSDPPDLLKNFVIKRYLPVTKDLNPEDMPGTWNTATEWQVMYINWLAANLVETESGFDVTPSDTYPLAVIERELEILGGGERKNGLPFDVLLGSKTKAPSLDSVITLEQRLVTTDADGRTIRNQTMNEHVPDAASLLNVLESSCIDSPDDLAFLNEADAVYKSWSQTDETTVEKKIADLFQQKQGVYLAGLMLDYTFAYLMDRPEAICNILNPRADLDADGLNNIDEIPSADTLYETPDPFASDTDGDGINDLADNCPSHSNPYQEDFDGDGKGDACDPDTDNDGLDDGTESAFGSNPYNTDTDEDGIPDLMEWNLYSDPGISITFTMLESPTKLPSQTIGGTIPAGVTSMEIELNGISQGPVSFTSVDNQWSCPITGISSGNNTVAAMAEDSIAGRIGYSYATIVGIAPRTLLVPEEYATIQAAIDAADNGDTVLVSPGTYPETINFSGKRITVSKTPEPENAVIDGGQNGTVVTFNNGESDLSVLNGFSITNGFAAQGAGIFCGEGTTPVITNNTIFGNDAYQNGGGVYVDDDSAPFIVNNTIDSNTAVHGGGIYCMSGAVPAVENNIITNSPPGAYEIWAATGALLENDYNNLWNTYGQAITGDSPGNSSISALPGFTTDGYWLLTSSPCIDVGNDGARHLPIVDREGKPRILDGDGDESYRVDLGSYEFGELCEGDISGDGDGDVDGVETAAMAMEFNRTNCTPSNPCQADLNSDGEVNAEDLEILVKDIGRDLCP